MTRALLLTSHPVDGRDGADKEIAVALAEGLRGVDFTYVGRVGVRSPVRGRKVAVLSRRGMPGLLSVARSLCGPRWRAGWTSSTR